MCAHVSTHVSTHASCCQCHAPLSCVMHYVLHLPASVPAVFEMPIKIPAYLGAMSIWLTEKPPLANPARASALVVAATPLATSFALGMNMSAIAAPTKPTQTSWHEHRADSGPTSHDDHIPCTHCRHDLSMCICLSHVPRVFTNLRALAVGILR